jgi:peptidoglycan/xylan/chitin deacetylase (PgdA/CDA1 family)
MRRREAMLGAGAVAVSTVLGGGLSAFPRPALARIRPIGVARTIAIESRGGPRIGRKSYADSLPLADGEVVLTFDDGPWPDTTPAVLDALSEAQTRATFFMIGRNALSWPAIARRVVSDGHTVANHTLSHPWTMRQRSFEVGVREIIEGERAISAAIGRPIAPFFRFPGFADTPALLVELARQDRSVWGTDVWASDWNQMVPARQLSLVVSRLKRTRGGVVLFHDTRPQTAAMMPAFLQRLAAENMRIVHAVPA